MPQWVIFPILFSPHVDEEKGNFGPWKICKDLNFGRQMCGPWGVSSFKPSCKLITEFLAADLIFTPF